MNYILFLYYKINNKITNTSRIMPNFTSHFNPTLQNGHPNAAYRSIKSDRR